VGGQDDQLALPSWLIKPVLLDGFSVIYGQSGSGKSFLALDWSLHVAAGMPWHGHRVKQVGPLRLCRKEPQRALALRKRPIKEASGIGTVPFLALPAELAIGKEANVSELDRVTDAALSEAKRRGWPPFALVVVDTLARTISGDENATEDMSAFVRGVNYLRGRLGEAAPR
jgi:RecA-family ATPase